MENYLVPDPGCMRWQVFQKELADRKKFATMLIPGEEISCLNDKKEVVHLCGLGMRDFLPGTLDGARKNRQKDPQLTLPEAINAIHEQNGIASAAHPGVRPGFLQRMFLFRGEWSGKDLYQDIDAMQIMNNGFSPSWHRGKALWITMLRQGYKVPLLAGNDAHGDFNRYRAIAVPFLSIGENPGRYMGFGKTGVYGRRDSISSIADGIKNGATFVTTGPFAALSLSVSPADSIITKQQLPADLAALYVHAISTPEFGAVRNITVYAGLRGNPAEKTIFSRNYTTIEYQRCEKTELASLPAKPSYVRAEVSCADCGSAAALSRAVTSAAFLS